MKKIIVIVLIVLSPIFFLMYRSLQLNLIHEKVGFGMTIEDTLKVAKGTFISPYACLWSTPKREKIVPTRYCKIPSEDVLGTLGTTVLIVYKGIGIDSHFEVIFDNNSRVSNIGELFNSD